MRCVATFESLTYEFSGEGAACKGPHESTPNCEAGLDGIPGTGDDLGPDCAGLEATVSFTCDLPFGAEGCGFPGDGGTTISINQLPGKIAFLDPNQDQDTSDPVECQGGVTAETRGATPGTRTTMASRTRRMSARASTTTPTPDLTPDERDPDDDNDGVLDEDDQCAGEDDTVDLDSEDGTPDCLQP